jgi:bacillithiol synthase
MSYSFKDRRETDFFSTISNDITYHQDRLASFLNRRFDFAHFHEQIEEKSKSFSDNKRRVLKNAIRNQYETIKPSGKVLKNIDLLEDPTTFTVTTGHQIAMYGGPLYFMYKIVHVIQLSELLSRRFPLHNFVPVFWMATEDHDFEEIATINLFGNSLTWETNQLGPVGRMVLDEGFRRLKEEMLGYFQKDAATTSLIQNYYTSDDANLAAATRRFVHDLFHDKGLVIVDGDDHQLKQVFQSTLIKELTTGFSSQAVDQQTKALAKLGYKPQVNARAINLFLLGDQKRERIIQQDDSMFRVGKEIFSLDQMLELIRDESHRFSPNVVLRPVYQETILPNLAYIGGGGEMAYWLQLKGVFDAANELYPLISVRNSVQIIDKVAQKKLVKLGLEVTAIFRPIDLLKKEIVLKASSDELNFDSMDQIISELSQELLRMITTVDDGLTSFALSEITRLTKQVDGVKQKLIRQQKKKFEDELNTLESLMDKLFPGGALQERKESALGWMAKYGAQDFLSIIFEAMHPDTNDLILILEDEN